MVARAMSETSDETPKDGESTASQRPPADQVGADEGAEGPASAEATSQGEPRDPLETAKAEAQKYREQLLRTAADFDNYRKRARREAEDAGRRGRETLLKELLPVFDNLERAAQSAETATDVKSLVEGIRMVLRQFSSTLERVNIKRVPTVGQPFDPSVHEAIQHVESAEHAAGLVAAEVQGGYQIGDYLVRAALVVVSKGPGPAGAGRGEAGGAGGEVGGGEAAGDGDSASGGDAPN